MSVTTPWLFLVPFLGLNFGDLLALAGALPPGNPVLFLNWLLPDELISDSEIVSDTFADRCNSPMITGCCASSPSKKNPIAVSPPTRAKVSPLVPCPPPVIASIATWAQGSSDSGRVSSQGWYPTILTLTLWDISPRFCNAKLVVFQ